MANLQKFEPGKSYQMSFIGDSELRPAFLCIKRTDKTATFKGKHEVITKRLKLNDGRYEYILAGSYSMSPSIRADRKI
jgi:hypothetical protein